MLKQEAARPAPVPTATPAGARAPVVRWLVGTVIVLVVAVAALGTMLVAPLVSTSRATELIDRNIAAWNEFDEETIRSVYTEDPFVLASSESDPSAAGIDEIVSLARWGGFSVERLGPVTEKWSLVTYPVHASTTYDLDGEYRVRRPRAQGRKDRPARGDLGERLAPGRREWYRIPDSR